MPSIRFAPRPPLKPYRLSGRISSGAAPPSRPLSQGVTFFETSRGSNTSSKLEHFGFIFGSPGPQKTRFSCGRCCIFEKSSPNRSRKPPGTSRSSLWPSWGSFCPSWGSFGASWGSFWTSWGSLWASWGAPGALLALPGRSREPPGDPWGAPNWPPGGLPGGLGGGGGAKRSKMPVGSPFSLVKYEVRVGTGPVFPRKIRGSGR